MNQQGVFWSAAEADAQSCGKSVEDYLQGLQDKFDPYMRSDHVFDRDGLKKGMRDLITRKKNSHFHRSRWEKHRENSGASVPRQRIRPRVQRGHGRLRQRSEIERIACEGYQRVPR